MHVCYSHLEEECEAQRGSCSWHDYKDYKGKNGHTSLAPALLPLTSTHTASQELRGSFYFLFPSSIPPSCQSNFQSVNTMIL